MITSIRQAASRLMWLSSDSIIIDSSNAPTPWALVSGHILWCSLTDDVYRIIMVQLMVALIIQG